METHITRQQILDMEKVPRLKLINSVSGFKSANLIGTTDTEGRENLAIFSSVIHLGSDPPLLGFITRPDTVPRHTYQNLRAMDWFTINHVHEGIYTKAHQTSGKYREDISEFERVGLTPWYSEACPAPYVAESRIRMGMRPVEEHTIEANGTILLVASIEELILTDEYIDDEHTLDLEQAETVAISGIERYHRTQRLDTLNYVRLPDEISRDDA